MEGAEPLSAETCSPGVHPPAKPSDRKNTQHASVGAFPTAQDLHTDFVFPLSILSTIVGYMQGSLQVGRPVSRVVESGERKAPPTFKRDWPSSVILRTSITRNDSVGFWPATKDASIRRRYAELGLGHLCVGPGGRVLGCKSKKKFVVIPIPWITLST